MENVDNKIEIFKKKIKESKKTRQKALELTIFLSTIDYFN